MLYRNSSIKFIKCQKSYLFVDTDDRVHWSCIGQLYRIRRCRTMVSTLSIADHMIECQKR